MTDPRIALHATYAHWLRLRAQVGALAASLVAAEYALRRDARGSDDRDYATLVEQMATERHAAQMLVGRLDARIAEVKLDCDAVAARHVESIVATACADRPGVS